MSIYGEGGVGFRIESVWAYLAVHKDGDEGIVGLGNLPMIGADKARIESLRPYAETMASLPGSPPIVLVQFTHRIDIETL